MSARIPGMYLQRQTLIQWGTEMQNSANYLPVARVLLLGDESVYPGWYIQHYVRGKLVSTRLEIDPTSDTTGAIIEASGYIGCVPEQIQVGGSPWPNLELSM